MAVMMSPREPREKWTDERLDDLSKKVDQGFSGLKAEMKEGFERMESRFGEVDKRLGRLEEAYFALNRTMWGGTCVIVAALISSGIFG